MYDELTRQDLQKMQEEIDYRVQVLRPRLIEDVQTARAFGDLSENYEYKAAKQELRRCDSRLRYLKKMIETAKVIHVQSDADKVGLFDTVEVYFEDDDEVERLRIMTTLREDVLQGIISKESPIGNGIRRLIPQAQNGHIRRSVQRLVFLAVPAAPQRVHPAASPAEFGHFLPQGHLQRGVKGKVIAQRQPGQRSKAPSQGAAQPAVDAPVGFPFAQAQLRRAGFDITEHPAASPLYFSPLSYRSMIKIA